MNLSHYSFLSLEIRFFQKIGFLKPRFLVKNPTIFIHYSAFLNSGIGSWLVVVGANLCVRPRFKLMTLTLRSLTPFILAYFGTIICTF